MEMIQLKKLSKVFKGLRAVNRIDLNVPKGVIFGFLGPNGAGKTTTIKMMAGVLRPTEGKIIIKGMDLARMPSEVKRCIGFIPDRPFVYEKLTGLDFLHFIAGLYGINNSSTEKKILRLLDTFDLTDWENELVESYSHGMKQRLVMCSALIHGPDLIIVDEPMVGLDPKGARLVKNIFRQEAQKGTTIFMSTHSLEVAEELCDDIAIIQKGEIIARGTAEELRKKAGEEGNLESIFLKLTETEGIAHEGSLSSY